MRRALSIIFAAALLCANFNVSAIATNDIVPYASLTLSYHDAGAVPGSRGKICIEYDVRSNKLADSIGVASIRFYKSDGTYVTTIMGTQSNGLVRTNGSRNSGSYEYPLTSGTSYYAEVTLYASVGSETDSRTVTTSTVRIP